MRSRRHSGFSLIELAVVLVIIGLLVGGGIAALEATQTQTQRADQRRQLEQVRDALIGFAMSSGRLPCPDTDYPPDGRENIDPPPPTCPVGDPDNDDDCDCVDSWGALPWAQLGVGATDAWGQRLRYRVYTDVPDADWPEKPRFADPDANRDDPAFGLDAYKNYGLMIEGNDDDGDGNRDTVADEVAAVVVSYGPQGRQIWTADDFDCVAAGVDGFSEDEHENCDDNNLFVAASYRSPEGAGDPTDPGRGRFDDMLTWIATPTLKMRMVEAGTLP